MYYYMSAISKDGALSTGSVTIIYLLLRIISVHANLKNAAYRLQSEKDRLKSACEAEATILLTAPASNNVVATLRNALSQALVQNTELKNRLNRVHDIADLADVSSVGPTTDAVSMSRTE